MESQQEDAESSEGEYEAPMTPQQELELFNFVKSTNLQTESGMSVMKKFIEFFIETDIKLNEDAVNKHYTFFESLFSMVS